MTACRIFLLLCLVAVPQAATANNGSLMGRALAQDRTRPLIQPGTASPLLQLSAPDTERPVEFGSSLFSDRAAGTFFAPPAPRTLDHTSGLADRLAPLRDLIASAEAGPAGYDAVQYGARIKPTKRPSQMTLAEIFAWIDATPGQPHAIGRYQFIPKTLARLVTAKGADPNQVFTPTFQDHLANRLIAEAGIGQLHAGTLSRTDFMNNLAKIWAGLPTSSGKSHYHGFAGNRATLTWASFHTAMAAIFPD